MISFLRRNNRRMHIPAAFTVTAVILLTACGGESEKMVRKKLEVICKDDLAAVTDSIAVENLIERPYYNVVFFKHYPEGRYSYKAVIDFYFLKKVHVKVTRKYRYLASVGMWDRYSNEYVFLHDTATTAVPEN